MDRYLIATFVGGILGGAIGWYFLSDILAAFAFGCLGGQIGYAAWHLVERTGGRMARVPE